MVRKHAAEPRNVFAPLAQRRQMNLDRVETEQQILPESSCRDFRVEVGVGRRDQPHVGLARPRRSETLELAGLEHAQQLLLLAERHVGDLVEEQRAAVGHLESPDAILLRIGERALHMAEELALEDAFRDAAGVDGDHRAGRRATDTPCSACATRLLPVPFSPVMSTLASDGPTRSMI